MSNVIKGWIQPFQKAKNGDREKAGEFNLELSMFSRGRYGTQLSGVSGHLDLFDTGTYSDIGLSLNSQILTMDILQEVKATMETKFKDVEVVDGGCPDTIPVEITADAVYQDWSSKEEKSYTNLNVQNIKLV